MDIDFITRLLDLVERTNVAELDLTIDGAHLRIVKASAPAQAVDEAPMPRPETVQATASATGSLPATSGGPKLHAIKAGFPGTFYRAPAPGSAPFVSVGDTVADGKQLAIVEAMKTMNPVEADVGGTIARIAVEDGQPVESGDLLFEIERHG